ncbi:hypothetical protein Lalb_Chr10g0099401 [Lupinus albus]|uniref:Uncharacterized protein n=1 Tax=Lupinus albus TaxID=3870 RepID=A0A6A4PVC7_LUPAL|nr:hypothetical protein Lalb_Chr10g0099401 [Lupinus albus]
MITDQFPLSHSGLMIPTVFRPIGFCRGSFEAACGGICSCIKAAIWSLFHALKYLNRLMINLDCSDAISLVQMGCNESYHCADLVKNIENILPLFLM